MENTKIKKPLFHIIKRTDIPFWKSGLYTTLAVLLGLFLTCIIFLIMFKANPFEVIGSLFRGCFGTERRRGTFFREFSLLLCVGLALIPSFKMKFWNLGGNGQILISALVTIMCMILMGRKGINDTVIILTMIPLSVLAGMIWALIPAIFKAFFNTNESLFTLMMNYIASGLVSLFIAIVIKDGSGSMPIIKTGNLPNLFNNRYALPIVVVIIVFIFIFVFLKYTKKGYEVLVVGESIRTAKYIGINDKKVIISTLCLSGAICGIVGLLLAGAINYSVAVDSAKNMGFTAIMTTYLAKFDPILTVVSSFLVTFVNKGMDQVKTTLGVTNSSIADLTIGMIYFFVIGVNFFINYKVVFNHSAKKDAKEDK